MQVLLVLRAIALFFAMTDGKDGAPEKRAGLTERRAGCMARADEASFCLAFLFLLWRRQKK